LGHALERLLEQPLTAAGRGQEVCRATFKDVFALRSRRNKGSVGKWLREVKLAHAAMTVWQLQLLLLVRLHLTVTEAHDALRRL
jgi:hypothetical protein